MNHFTEKARRYLLSHFAEVHNIEEISTALDISYECLRKIFARDMGVPLSDYLHAVRVENATALLKDREKKLYTVAREVGYSNEQTLIRNFKKITGLTPKEYKRNTCDEVQPLPAEKMGGLRARFNEIPKINTKTESQKRELNFVDK